MLDRTELRRKFSISVTTGVTTGTDMLRVSLLFELLALSSQLGLEVLSLCG